MAHACFGNYKDEKNCRNCTDGKKCKAVEPEPVVVKKKSRSTKKESATESVVDAAEAMAQESLGL